MEWTIERGPSRQPGFDHLQVRTTDQLCSFATLIGKDANVLRQKAADGKSDVFTLMGDTGHTTMNVIGKITYQGKWPKEKK